MQVSKQIHEQLVKHFQQIQHTNRCALFNNKREMRRLVEEQTKLKRVNAAIGELLRNLQPKESK